MEFDDGVRAKEGVVVCLRDMGNDSSRIFFDDVASESEASSKSWSQTSFFTFTPAFNNTDLNEMTLSSEDYQQIGEVLVARLLALSGRAK